jgi:hypothetical protein
VGLSYDETSELAGASLKVVAVQFAKSYSQWVARPEKKVPNSAYQ